MHKGLAILIKWLRKSAIQLTAEAHTQTCHRTQINSDQKEGKETNSENNKTEHHKKCGKMLRIIGDNLNCQTCGKHFRQIGDDLNQRQRYSFRRRRQNSDDDPS